MAAKQKLIAEELGLSIMTVSRALRNHPDVSEETKNKVIQKALELNYNKTPALGRSEATIKRIAVLAYDSFEGGVPALFNSNIQQRIFKAVQLACRKKHIETVVELPPRDEVPLVIQKRSVNGALIFGRYTKALADKFGSIPAISVSSFREEASLPQVVAKNSMGMRLAVEHLISLGHKKIVFLLPTDDLTDLFRERARGYMAAMIEHGLAPVIKSIPLHEIADLSCISEFSAAACASDYTAICLKKRMEENGLRIPRDLSVVGFDNLQEIDWLTSYGPDWDEIGNIAVNLLLFCPLELRSSLQVAVSGEMVYRESTAACLR